MKKLSWSPELAMNNEMIDDQHKELIRIANGLMRAIALGRDTRTFINVIRKLREYTVFHFSSEEALMDELGFPQRGAHATEHQKLKTQVKDFQHQIYHQEALTAPVVLDFMKSWLLNHLLTYDRDFAIFIKDCLEAEKEKDKAQEEPDAAEDTEGAEASKD